MSDCEVVENLVKCCQQFDDMGFVFERAAVADGIKEINSLRSQVEQQKVLLDEAEDLIYRQSSFIGNTTASCCLPDLLDEAETFINKLKAYKEGG